MWRTVVAVAVLVLWAFMPEAAAAVTTATRTHRSPSTSLSPTLTPSPSPSQTPSHTPSVALPPQTPPPPTAAPINVPEYYPVGPPLALPGLTYAPRAWIPWSNSDGDAEANSTTVPSDTNANEKYYRNVLVVRMSHVNEYQLEATTQLIGRLLEAFLATSPSWRTSLLSAAVADFTCALSLTSARLTNQTRTRTLQSMMNTSWYSADNIASRLLPLNSMELGPIASMTPRIRVRRGPSVSYGTRSVVLPLVVLRANITTGMRLAPSPYYPTFAERSCSSVAEQNVPGARSASRSSSETDALCSLLSQIMTAMATYTQSVPITTVSNEDDYLLSSLLGASCVYLSPASSAAKSAGINVLWVILLIAGGLCIIAVVYLIFVRTRGDNPVEPVPGENEAVAAMQAVADATRPSERPAVDTRTETSEIVETERARLLRIRQEQRIQDLVEKALTGEMTIYGASDEEREVVAMILNSPKFDGGALSREDVAQASPLHVVLEHDRMFRLPPKSEGHLDMDATDWKGGAIARAIRRLKWTQNRQEESVEMAPLSSEGVEPTASPTAANSSNSNGVGGGVVTVATFHTNPQDKETAALLSEMTTANDAAENLGSPDDDITAVNRRMTEAALRAARRMEQRSALMNSGSVRQRLLKVLENDDESL